MFRKVALVGSALALVAAPLAAEQARDNAPVADTAEIGGGNGIYFILGIAAVAAAIAFLSEDDDQPASM